VGREGGGFDDYKNLGLGHSLSNYDLAETQDRILLASFTKASKCIILDFEIHPEVVRQVSSLIPLASRTQSVVRCQFRNE